MPDGPEIKVNVSTGGGAGAINDLTGSIEKLARGVQGADNEVASMVDQLKALAQQIGVDSLAWDAFNKAIEGVAKKAGDGKVAIRELREALVDVSGMQMAGGGSAWKEGGGEADIRSIRKAIDTYEELNRAVRTYIESANVAAASGKLVNLPQFEARAENIYSRYPLSSEHVGSINTALGSLSGSNNDIEVERQLAQMEKDRTQEQRESNKQTAQEEKDRYQSALQMEKDYAQMERDRAQQEQQALRENIQMQREIAQMQAERTKQTDQSWEAHDKEELTQLAQLEKDRDQQRIQREREYDQMERERSQQEQQALRDNAQMEREVAQNRANEIRAQAQGIENQLRLERELVALENRATLAGTRGTTRVEAQRGIFMRGMEGGSPEQQSRANNAFNMLSEAEEGGGGLSARMMRGVVQGAMGVGAGNYQLYYLMNSISNIGAGSAAAAGVAAGGVGLLALAAAQVAAANAASQHARELRNMSMELGTTTKNARELENVAKVTGVPMDSVVSGMRQLTMGIEESGGRGRGNSALLKGIGINPLTDTGGLKDTKELLFEISDVIKGMDNLQARDILERLFGRGGRELLPMLKQDLRGSTEALKELNSNLDSSKFDDYAQAMSRIGLQWEGLVATFATPIVASVKFVTDSAGGIMTVLAWLMGGSYSTKESREGQATKNIPNLVPNSPLLSQDELNSRKLDYQAGDAYAGIQERLQAHTAAGIADALKDAEAAHTEAVRVQKAPGERGLDARRRESDTVTSTGANVAAIKAEQKAMEDKGQALIAIQRQIDKASETEVSGYQKIKRELQDNLQLLNDRLRLGDITQTQLDAQSAAYQKLAVAERSAYDIRVGKSSIKDYGISARTLGANEITNERSMAASTLALRRIQSRYSIPTSSSIYEDYQFSIDEAQAKRSSSMLSLGGEYDEMQEARGSGDTIRANSLQSQINTRKNEINSTYETDKQKAINTLLGERANLIDRATDAQSKYNSALGEMKTNAIESATKLQEGLLKNRLSNSMQLTRARARGQGAGGQGVMADNEFGYSVHTINTAIEEAHSGYIEAIASESKRSSDVLANPAINADQISAEKTKHAQEDFQIEQRLRAELGEQLKAIDDAHTERQKTSIELMQQQNEQVKAFAGDLLGAYMQAMLHRQSGSFPVREALGQQFLGWGKKIGENVVGTGFGMLQHAGVGGHDIIPGLAHQVANDIDPTTGTPRVINGSTTHEALTGLGKVVQGTPLGHRPAANDQYVSSIDTTTKAIYTLLQNTLGLDGSGPYFPGQTTDVANESGASALPIGWNSPLGSGSEAGAIINSIAGGRGSAGAVRGGSSNPFGGILSSVGGLFHSGSGSTSSTNDTGNFDSQGNFISAGSWVNPGSLPPGMNLPLSSGAENGSIINSLAGMSGYSSSASESSGANSGLTITGVDANGLPTYSSSVNVSASAPSPLTALASATKPGQFGPIDTSTASSTLTGVANDAALGVKAAAAVVTIGDSIKGIASGKTVGVGPIAGSASKDLAAAGGVASMFGPVGMVVGAGLEIGALVAAGVSAIFGDPKQQRLLQEQYDAQQHQWTAPSAYNLVTSQNGMSVTGDITGAPRQFNGPLLAYPNTSSYTSAYDYTVNRVGPQIAPPSGVAWPGGGSMSVPGGVSTLPNTILSLYINALDNKSIIDNADILATAVHTAINGGHPIRNAIQAAANPR